jgi:uncharacterized protein (TIRG00374 family)
MKLVAGYAVAVLLLWVFLRNAEWQVLVDGFRSVGWMVLGAAVALRLLSLVVASLRWQVLLAPVRSVRLSRIVAAMMMGMAVNAIAPMQAAEVARPYLLSRRQHLDFSATLATVMVEWVLDALGVLALLLPAMFWLHNTGSAKSGLAVSAFNRAIGLFVILAVAGLIALRRLPRWVARVGNWAHRPGGPPESARSRLAAQCELFAVGLRILDRRRGLLAVAGYSLLVAVLTALSSWMVLIAFGLPVSLVSGFVILGLTAVGGMIPTPGAVGGFHAVCQLGLVTFFDVERARTVLPVIALHAVLYIPAAAIGALCFLSMTRQPQGFDA